MLHDYWMYRPDPAPVRSSLRRHAPVLDLVCAARAARRPAREAALVELHRLGFERRDAHLRCAAASRASPRSSTWAHLNDAADLEKHLGDPMLAGRYHDRAAHVRSGIPENAGTPERGLIADNPDQKVFSQQANILGVLYDVVPKEQSAGSAQADAGDRAGHHSRRHAERLLLLPLLSGACAGARRHGRRIPAVARTVAQAAAAALQHLAGNSRAKLVPIRMHGRRTPSTTCSRWWRASNPASPGFPTVRIAPHSGRCRRFRRTIRTGRADRSRVSEARAQASMRRSRFPGTLYRRVRLSTARLIH